MSRHQRAWSVRLAWAMLPALAAGCVGSLPGAQQAPGVPQQATPAERRVTLTIDPQTGERVEERRTDDY